MVSGRHSSGLALPTAAFQLDVNPRNETMLHPPTEPVQYADARWRSPFLQSGLGTHSLASAGSSPMPAAAPKPDELELWTRKAWCVSVPGCKYQTVTAHLLVVALVVTWLTIWVLLLAPPFLDLTFSIVSVKQDPKAHTLPAMVQT